MTTLPGPALVVGAGPAGLMAAEQLLAAGIPTIVTDRMPTPARKFLMAGKSGLNITRNEDPLRFKAAYGAAEPFLTPALEAFGPTEVADWCRGLGQPLFSGSSGKMFPAAMKASPLLRAWLARLGAAGLDLRLRWQLVDLSPGTARFATPDGTVDLTAPATVLALGGASWPRLGSDGTWPKIVAPHGVRLEPFRPSNMGFSVAWSAHMAPHFGKPVKPLALSVGDRRSRGEIVVSARGIEGGGLYPLSAALRDGGTLHLDLVPDLPADRAAARLAARPPGETAARALQRGLALDPVRLALALELGRPWPGDAAARAARVKALPLPLGPPYPIAEAISTAGGIARDALTPQLELRTLPGVFVAGEMIDWDAPTGGYLLTACLATGRFAGRSAAGHLGRRMV